MNSDLTIKIIVKFLKQISQKLINNNILLNTFLIPKILVHNLNFNLLKHLTHNILHNKLQFHKVS